MAFDQEQGRTESVLTAGGFCALTNSEASQFIGRAVAAIAADPASKGKSGQVLVDVAVALEYGFTDVDGTQLRPPPVGAP